MSILLSCNASSKKPESIKVVSVINHALFPILDSIILHESYCDYYTPSLIFSIILDKRNNYVVIGSIGSKVYKSENLIGCFEYGKHLFLVKGESLDDTLFKKSSKNIAISFEKSETHYNKDEDIFIIDSDGVQDDSFSYWYYKYKNNQFTYYSSSNCCDK